MLTFDHLAVSAQTLDEGVAAIEAALGVPLAGGGQHPHMSTHNRLIGLGDLYLEVIASDPTAPKPAWPRWFNLDNFTGRPRLTNWIVRCKDLYAEVALGPRGIGTPIALSRGDFRWEMAVPVDGHLPFDGCFPALIRWQGAAHPAARLPDANLRLTQFEIAHPEAAALTEALANRLVDPRVRITQGALPAMRATFTTPHGIRHIE